MKIARNHADLIRPRIEADGRFADVDAGAYTGDGGVVWIVGRVASDDDLNALKKLVVASNPPLDVKWNVEAFE